MYPDENDPERWRPAHRSHAMEMAAFLFAVFSMLGCMIVYIAVPCGALAILFAFLSRGKTRKLKGQARFAAILGAAGMISSVLITAYLFYQIYTNPSLRAQVRYFFNQYAKQSGLELDFDSVFGLPASDSAAPEEGGTASGQENVFDGIFPGQEKETESYYDSRKFWEDLFAGKNPKGNLPADDGAGDEYRPQDGGARNGYQPQEGGAISNPYSLIPDFSEPLPDNKA